MSCLPPERTGVADFAHQLLCSRGNTIRAYAAPDAWRAYLADNPFEITRWRARQRDVLEHDAGLDLEGVVVMLGNSSHFVGICEWMVARRVKLPLLLYLHDTFLLSLLRLVSPSSEIVAQLSLDHGRKVHLPEQFDDIAPCVERSELGAAVLTKLARPDLVLVNSLAAKQMIANEPGWPADVPVEAVFHPVFPASVQWHGSSPVASRVGSFGVPTPFKRIDLIIEAHTIRRATDTSATLVLAGYGFGDFATEHGLAQVPGVEIHDSPSDAKLDRLMASVDIAVQLRSVYLGETSGMIARLLAVGTPIIASPRGSTGELGEAIAFLDPSATAAGLAELIAQELAQPDRRRAIARNIVERRTPENLVSRIQTLAREAASRQRSPTG